MSIEQIRKMSWNELEKRHYGMRERAFRPEGMFSVGGNINLSLGREMGMMRVSVHEKMREVNYRIKCLFKNKRKES